MSHRRHQQSDKKVEPRRYEGVPGVGAKRVKGTVGEVHHAAQPIDDVQTDGYDQKHPAQNKAVEYDVNGSPECPAHIISSR